MATYTVRIKYVDEREITIEADSDGEAEAKYLSGDWDGEDTIDFYALEETRGLRKENG